MNIKVENNLFDQYLGNNFGILIFDNTNNICNKIKKLESSKIFRENIHLLDKDHEFNKDKKIYRWSKENNITAAIYRPDQHIYGCVGHENVVTDIDKLTNKLINELI